MKNKFLIIAVVFIVTIGGIYAWWRLTSFRDISFDFKRQPLSVKIVDSNKTTVATLTNNAKLNLQDGTYLAYPSGGDIDENPIKFTTNKNNTTIVFDPSVSFDTLKTSLVAEREDIVAEIFAKYPNLIAQFTVDRGQLLHQADWYITTLSYKDASNDSPRDTYKIILHKVDNVWTIVGSPQIIPTKYNFPSVPSDVIKSAFDLLKDSR